MGLHRISDKDESVGGRQQKLTDKRINIPDFFHPDGLIEDFQRLLAGDVKQLSHTLGVAWKAIEYFPSVLFGGALDLSRIGLLTEKVFEASGRATDREYLADILIMLPEHLG